MKQRTINWMLGTILTASLAMSAPAHGATKARIAAAKIHRVTQITDRDVALSRNPVARTAKVVRVTDSEYGRRVLLPNPDSQRRVLLPNPDSQRRVLLPNPDSQRRVLLPNPDSERRVLLPNPDSQRRVLLPNPDSERRVLLPNPDSQ